MAEGILSLSFVFSMLLFLYCWEDEIIFHFRMIEVYWGITCIAVAWLMHFGSKYYYLWYKHPDDEAGEFRIIEFPCIWW